MSDCYDCKFVRKHWHHLYCTHPDTGYKTHLPVFNAWEKCQGNWKVQV